MTIIGLGLLSNEIVTVKLFIFHSMLVALNATEHFEFHFRNFIIWKSCPEHFSNQINDKRQKPTVFTFICSLYELLKCTMCTKDVDSSINVKTIKRKPRRLYHWKAAEETLYINKSNSVARINNRANNKINVESFNFNNIPFIFNDQITFHDTRNTQTQDISIITRNSNRNLYSNNYRGKVVREI